MYEDISMFGLELDGSNVNFLVAFVAGFITFFASCLLPLVPTYLAYISGVSLSTMKEENHRWVVFKAALLFVTGFVTTFVIMGITLQRFAVFFAEYRGVITQLAGVLFIFMGLLLLGAFKKLRLVNGEVRFDIQKFFVGNTNLHAVFTGVAFGFAWTPCIGPVLAVILYWSASQANMWRGILLLISYGIGLGIPFLLAALGFDRVMKTVSMHPAWTKRITQISALIIVIAGVAMVTGKVDELSIFLVSRVGLSALAK